MLGNDIVGSFNVANQHVTISDINTELVLQSFVDMNTGFDVEVTSFVAPVSIEGERNSLSYETATFQRSGSTLLSRSWMQRMIRLAVRPG